MMYTGEWTHNEATNSHSYQNIGSKYRYDVRQLENGRWVFSVTNTRTNQKLHDSRHEFAGLSQAKNAAEIHAARG